MNTLGIDLFPSFTILLLFGCLLAYEYIRDLRRTLKTERANGETAWRLYDNAHRELCALKGLPVPTSSFPEQANGDKKTDSGFRPGRIGPTAIMDRELARDRVDEALRTPPFANPQVLNPRTPTPDEIAAAYQEAHNSGSN